MKGFGPALRALEDAGVPTRLRKATPVEGDPEGGELDLWIAAKELGAAELALRPAGFFPFDARGLGVHRFFLSFDSDAGRWLKLDMKLEANTTPRAGRPGRVGSALARRRPAGGRRLGPLIAVLGPDGAGKGTLIAGLKERCPVAVTEVYLGRRTRQPPGGEPRHDRPSLLSKVLPEWVVLLWKALRDERRLLPAYTAAWRGHIVLCDRHPIEVLAVRPARSPLATRLERFLARHVIPWPDLILVLDAPAEQLYRRKREHPVEVLERWRRGYTEAFGPHGAVVISTAVSKEESLRQASMAVWEALRSRRGW